MKRRLMARETAARAWRETAEFAEKYAAAKAEAVRRAEATGYDHGIEVFDGAHPGLRSCVVRMLPCRDNRFGHELRCEVVSCSDLARQRPGHGCAPDQEPRFDADE